MTTSSTPIQISAIPILQDNYVWTIQVEGQCWLVDPGEAEPVLAYLQQTRQRPTGILITHNHWDHVSGIDALCAQFNLPVYGPDNPDIPHLSHRLSDGDRIYLGSHSVEIMSTPGHTLDHIAYYLPASGALLCGDTLFAAGCGRLFSGTMEQLFHSLQRLKALPPETLVYCTHEYTLANLDFAQAAEPDNAAIAERRRACENLRAKGLITLPSTMAQELATNPFLRTHHPNLQKLITKQPADTPEIDYKTFNYLREWKNRY